MISEEYVYISFSYLTRLNIYGRTILQKHTTWTIESVVCPISTRYTAKQHQIAKAQCITSLQCIEITQLSVPQRIYNPNYGNGVFGNVYLLALDNTKR